jgi:hypothetical protein
VKYSGPLENADEFPPPVRQGLAAGERSSVPFHVEGGERTLALQGAFRIPESLVQEARDLSGLDGGLHFGAESRRYIRIIHKKRQKPPVAWGWA